MSDKKLENLNPFQKGQSGNPAGRPKGSKNRASIVKHWLEATESIVNPLTGEKETLSQQDIMTLAIIKKARKGDVAAYRELMDSAHGKITEHTDITSGGEPVSIPVIKWAGESENGDTDT